MTLPAAAVVAAGVSVAVQVMPPSLELTLLSVPLPTVRSALVKPVTASLKVKVTIEVSPMVSKLSATTMVAVGALVSMVMLSPVEAVDTLLAASAALAVRVCEPADRVDDVIDQLPPVAVPVPSTVVPSVS